MVSAPAGARDHEGLIRTGWELRQARVFRARSPGF